MPLDSQLGEQRCTLGNTADRKSVGRGGDRDSQSNLTCVYYKLM